MGLRACPCAARPGRRADLTVSTSPLVAKPVSADIPGSRHVVLLHGIYGRGRNWLAIARQLVVQRPEWTCWLADLRHHGDASSGDGPGSLDDLAGDVEVWAREQGITPDAVLGHSFGGKVALAYAAREAARPLQTWLIDSTPEAREPSGSAWEMLQIVRSLPDTFATRQELIAGIEAGGFGTDVAQWMSTNLVRDGDRFRWRLDFDVMEQLLHAFFQTGFWDVLDPGAPDHDIHVLKASRSNVITPATLERLQRLEGAAAPGHARIHVHQAEGGHWIHAEAPALVIDLLARNLP